MALLLQRTLRPGKAEQSVPVPRARRWQSWDAAGMPLEAVLDPQGSLSTLMPVLLSAALHPLSPWAHLEGMYVSLLVEEGARQRENICKSTEA